MEESSFLIIKSSDGNISIQPADNEETVRVDSTNDETRCELSEDRKTVSVSSDDDNLSIRVPSRIISIQISKDDGSIAIKNITSDIAMKLGDGSIAISGVNGKIHVALDDGTIAISDVVSDEIALVMQDGTISINLNQPVNEGSFKVKLNDGRISLALPSDSQCQITANVEDGTIQHNLQQASVISNDDGSYLNTTLNGGGADFVFSLEDGNIAIKSQ
ncbi:MAG: hypothetical protein QG641_2902 [Candidatus Poribacteria bacterium]|nr:hypothetical protein [Candidatus Poribacteria bacterium]